MTTVSSVAALLAVLKGAGAGAVISLTPGNWSGVVIRGVEAPGVTITGQGAVLHDLELRRSSGITFKDLEFSTAGYPVGSFGPKATYPFRLKDNRNIEFIGVNAHGDPNSTLANDVSGFFVDSSPNTTFSRDTFSYLHAAVVQLNSDHFTFTGNACHNNRDDCVDNVGSSWVKIIGNHCYSNHPDGKIDTDHPDCIQFWTNQDTHPPHDIDIEYNRYERGTGTATQFIFMRANYPAPYNLPFTNVTIKGNISEGSQLNGIVIMVAKSVDIENNRITAYCEPRIMAKTWIEAAAVEGLTLRNNKAAFYNSVGSKGINEGHNIVTACVGVPKTSTAEP